MTIHCLMTKTCELGACFLYFSYVLAQNDLSPVPLPGFALDLCYLENKKTLHSVCFKTNLVVSDVLKRFYCRDTLDTQICSTNIQNHKCSGFF